MALSEMLRSFLAREAARPWEMGEHDCGLWLADWYVFATGAPDPAAHLRGWHRGPGARRAGDAIVLRHLRVVARTLGLLRTTMPLPGDIAALCLCEPRARIAVGAIRVERGWIVPAGEPATFGLTKVPDDLDRARVVAAWSIECPS